MKKILIVDDDRSILSIFEFILNKKKISCLVSDTRKKAIEIYNKNKIDLIFIDAKLKNDSGIGLFKLIKKNNKEIPIIMMTGHKTDDLVEEMFEEGASLILYKPFDVDEILNLINLSEN